MTQVIRTVLEVDASRAVAGFKQGERAVNGYAQAVKTVGSEADRAASQGGAGLGRLTMSIRENRAAWDDLSSKAMIGGAAVAAGLGLATKASVDWESAWAGVTKTVDGSPEQMAALEGELRQLATTLPATHAEIAGVAEAAGQLGIERENVAGFTKTMIDMGESTNLSAEEAATSIARFTNVMGTAQTDVDKVGSALVGLGNNFATTESEIMDMSSRLSGAGRQANMTEGDILGIATAMSSVGIESQAGGTAMSRVIIEMGKSVDTGTDKLETFAEVAGMSTEAFSKLWNENSGEAMNRFIQGLGEMQARGESLEPTLQELGMTDIRVGDALRRSASAADQFGAAMATGNEEFDKGSALAEEAAKRYETTESRMRIAMNSIKDAAIDLGSVIGPALAKVAEGAAGLANAFVQLPGPVKASITAIAGVSAAVGLIGGATVKAIGWMQDFRGTLDSIGLLTPRVEKNLGRAQRAAVGFGKALTGLAIAGVGMAALQDDLERIGSQQLIRDLNSSGDAIGSIDDAIKKANAGTSDVTSLGKALQVAFDPNWIDSTGKAVDGFFSFVTMGAREADGEIAQSNRRLKEVDETLAQMVSSGNVAGAKEQFQAIAAAAKVQGISVEELRKKFPQYAEALAGAENASSGAADGMGEIESAADQAAEATEGLKDAITGLGDAMLAQEASEDGYFATLSEVNRALEENGATLSKTTEAGRKNRAALRDLAESTQEWAAASIEAGGSAEEAQGILDKGRKSYIDTAVAMGMPKAEAKALADELFRIPDDVTSDVKVTGMGAAVESAVGLGVALGAVPEEKKITVDEFGSATSAQRVDFLNRMIGVVPMVTKPSVTEQGATASRGRVLSFNDSIIGLDGKKVLVTEAGAHAATGRVLTMDGAIFGLDDRTVQVKEVGATASGARVVELDGKIYALDGTSVDVIANVHGTAAVGALAGAIGGVHDKTVTVTARAVGAGAVAGLGFADGGFFEPERYADGGMRSIGSQQSQIRAAGGAGITWAEDGAGPWESFISGHPAKAARSKSIWLETGKRLGMIEAYADGAMRQYGPSRHHYVAPTPRVTVRAPAAPQLVPAGVSAAQMEAAVERGIAKWSPRWGVNGRDFAGVMQRTNRDRRGR